jgi:hypothetical protein
MHVLLAPSTTVTGTTTTKNDKLQQQQQTAVTFVSPMQMTRSERVMGHLSNATNLFFGPCS